MVIDNQIDQNQRVTVSATTGDIQVHGLSLTGDAPDQMTIVGVTGGATLAATTNVTVGSNSRLELGAGDGGTGDVAADMVNVSADAVVAGNGAVRGDITLGSRATLSPGFSVGHVDVKGDYKQLSDSNLVMDVEGDAAGEFDTVDISGRAELAGTLTVNAELAANFAPGAKIELLTADQLVENLTAWT